MAVILGAGPRFSCIGRKKGEDRGVGDEQEGRVGGLVYVSERTQLADDLGLDP